MVPARRTSAHQSPRSLIGSALGILLGLGLAAAAPPALAQERAKPADLEDLSLEQLMAIEVESVFGASRYLQRITEAPASVSIVTADEIARYGYRTLADALRMVRGIYVNSDRQYSFVGMRSFQRPGDYNTHVLLTVDGHRINDNIYEQATIDEAALVLLEDVERIEVIRGPSSSLYGSNAFFGVINVVTRGGRGTKGFEASVDGGSFARRGARVSWGQPLGASGGVSISASASRVDGPEALYYPEFDEPATSFGVSRDLDFTERRHLRASLDVGGVSMRAAYNSRRKGVPTGAYGILFNDPRSALRDRQGYVDLAWERQWAAGVASNVRVFYDDSRYDGYMPYDYGEPGAPLVVENRDQSIGRWGGAEARVSGARGRHRWAAGMEYRRHFEQTQRNFDVEPVFVYLDDRRRGTTTGWYAQDDIKLSQALTASVGLRHDTYARFDDPTKPRLALIVTPTKRRTFKLLYGEAYRAPNAYETYYLWGEEYKANPALRPEDARTMEVAWEEYVGRHYRVGANLFAYRVENLITQIVDPADGMLVYANVGSATARGVELEAEGRWGAGLHVRASYAWQRGRDAETSLRLTNSPEHVAQALASVPLGRRAFAGVSLRAISARTAKDGSRVAGYAVPALTLVAPALANRLRVQLVVDNLFDRRYADPAAEELRQVAIPQDGRTLALRLSWRIR